MLANVLGHIDTPPFYAVEVWPTPLGTSRGLRADVNGRVLAESGDPIAGLYICGNGSVGLGRRVSGAAPNSPRE
jgi:predicted oxidoreductase